MKVSFDFDGTLAKKYVQEYAKELVEKGIEVWIVTARYADINDYTPGFCSKYCIDDIHSSYQELFIVARDVGIPKERIQFMNMKPKCDFFMENPDFVWHLDDDWIELLKMEGVTKVPGVSALKDYKKECNELIKAENEKNQTK